MPANDVVLSEERVELSSIAQSRSLPPGYVFCARLTTNSPLDDLGQYVAVLIVTDHTSYRLRGHRRAVAADDRYAQRHQAVGSRSGTQWFDVLGAQFNGGMLIDKSESQNKTKFVVLPHQCALYPLHNAASYPNSLTHHAISERFISVPAKIGAKELDFGVRYGKGFAAISDNLEHPGQFKDPGPLAAIDTHEEVARKEGDNDLHTLPVLPHARSLVGGQETFDLTDFQLFLHRFLISGNREYSKPLTERL